MPKLSEIFRNPFSFFGAKSGTEERLAQYVIREHDRGRTLDEIMNDRYVLNRSTPQQRARILDRPEVIRAVGSDTVEDARRSLDGG